MLVDRPRSSPFQPCEAPAPSPPLWARPPMSPRSEGPNCGAASPAFLSLSPQGARGRPRDWLGPLSRWARALPPASSAPGATRGGKTSAPPELPAAPWGTRRSPNGLRSKGALRGIPARKARAPAAREAPPPEKKGLALGGRVAASLVQRNLGRKPPWL